MLNYKILDLADERGILCGKIFADLGAEVVKIEPPTGDTARGKAPFYKNTPHREHSLFWWAYSANKKSVTIDIESKQGQESLKKMVRSADFLIESFSPGYLSSIGLGYAELSDVNPRLIMISVTPFGQRGPYAGFKACDLVGSAMAGLAYLTGDPDRPPVRIGCPQFYHHGATGAAFAGLVAARWREKSGKGQWIDISCQESMARTLSQVPQNFEADSLIVRRGGKLRRTGKNVVMRLSWACKDGYVNFMLGGGPGAGASIHGLMQWMEEEGHNTTSLRQVDWNSLPYGGVSEEVLHLVSPPIESFFFSHSKQELVKQARERRMLLFPVCTIDEILQNPQLAARQFFARVENSLGSFTFPGSFMRQAGQQPPRPAPMLGEHNGEFLETGCKRLPKGKSPHSGAQALPVAMALQDVKILDFCWVAAGPMAVRYLTDLGATAIRVESKTRLDPLRTSGPFLGGTGLDHSLYFANYNTGKLGLTLNMKHPKSRGIIEKLVCWADIVAENFTPGTMEKWGLGFEQLRRIKPEIIFFSTSMLGRGGPDDGQPGFGPVLSALAGLTHITGWPDDHPVSPYGAYTDFIAPKFAAVALLAALQKVRRSGQGMHVEISQLEAALQYIAPLLLDTAVNGSVISRNGNSHPHAAPHGIYPCAGDDRWIAVAVFNDSEWEALCAVMGRPSWSRRQCFKTAVGRKSNEAELDRLIVTWTEQNGAFRLMKTLQEAGVSAGVVQNSQDLHQDPQLGVRRHFYSVDHPVMGRHFVQQNEARFQEEITYSRSPLLGEHTAKICREIIGLSEEEFARGKEEGLFT